MKCLVYMKYLKLFESYQSQKDLEILTRSICYTIGEDTYDTFGEGSIEFFTYVKLNEFEPNDYTVLNKFIIEFGDMIIGMITKDDIGSIDGKYVNDEKGKYIYLQEYEDIINTLNIILNFDNSDEYNKERFREEVYKKYKGILIHELQHAYDDWRSNGKYEDSKDGYYKRRDKAYTLKNKKKLKEEEKDFIKSQNVEYLNLKYEVDARFTESISNIDFYYIDELNNKLVIYPFSKVLSLSLIHI